MVRVLTFAAVACALATAAPHYTPPVCEPGVNMPQGDLPNMPIAMVDATACAAACAGAANCSLFSFHTTACAGADKVSRYYNDQKSPSRSSSCKLKGGCCWLKSEEVSGVAPVVNPCACSGYVRVPPDSFVPPAAPPAGKPSRNVLYVLIDDLRPQLEPYRAPLAVTPAFAALAANATVFDNAYCQISVCSPSRQSFLTGRRPATTGVYNFIDHFRQAECTNNEADRAFSGDVLRTASINNGCSKNRGKSPCGASGQCCTLCSAEAGCSRWTYTAAKKSCVLHGPRASASSVPTLGSICGVRGTLAGRAALTSLPEHFRNHGFLTLGTGKIFHTEEGGAGNIAKGFEWMNGPGMPPNEDPRSWSAGLSMAKVNDVANMFGCDINKAVGATGACAVNASLDGTVANPQSDPQLCDRVIADDAVIKLRLAAKHRAATGTPFFLSVGFRKPHLPFRFPAPFLDLFPAEELIPVAAHPTLDASVPTLAHHDGAPQTSPFVAVSNTTAQRWRRYYYAAVSWMDTQLGRVLGELSALGLDESTLVVMHSDHGWSLGEHGNWQK